MIGFRCEYFVLGLSFGSNCYCCADFLMSGLRWCFCQPSYSRASNGRATLAKVPATGELAASRVAFVALDNLRVVLEVSTRRIVA